MNLINSWRSRKKTWDRWNIKIRCGKVTLVDLYLDFAKKQYGLILFNMGVRTSPPQKKHHEDNSYEDISLF